MDFDLTKENIQPLRGGRNISQLEIALQAQSNRERERELLLQKEHFENLIRTYEGDDPLDNWYHYISWIEQSYPKHGHEGNLLPLLEHCLGKFENDKRYTNDRRFCKLWIKYIDLQKNPLELFQMMYARGLCRGCADLYRAWAYYHEAAEDFHNANLVFEYGRRELAQPFDELEIAHNNLFMAAGQHVLLGKDDRRLQEKRQALTSLHTYKPGKVGSVRTASGSAGTFASGQIRKTNVQVPVYEDFSDIRSAGAAPMSILTVAKREDAPKENTLKPGPWTTYPVKKGGHKMPPFTVHEDDEVMNVEGLRLPPDSFPKSTLEDFSSWHVNLTIAEAVDSNVVPMYPKLKVYSLPSSEYSLEEIRGVRYRQKMQSFSVPHGSFVSDVSQVSLGPQQVINVCDNHGEFKSPYNNSPSFQHKQYHMQSQPYVNDKFNPQHISSTEIHHVVVNQSNSLRQEPPSEFMGQIHSHQSNCIDEANKLAYKDQLSLQHSSVGWPQEHSLARKSPVQNKTHTSNYDIWNSSTPDASPKVKIVNEREPFSIYEQSNFTIGQPQPKVNAMKTPFRVLSADELAETGSRGGMDVAVTAQPIDSAARLLPQLSDERSTSSFEEMCNSNPVPTDLNTSCDTQMFNFNLNVMQVSTPQHEQLQRPEQREINGLTKKQLFSETGSEKSEKVLSTIFEETRSFGSSSGSSAATKSLIPSNQVTNTNMGTISEEHNSYLAQNLMANAALRSSLLGDLMDFDTHQPMQASPIHSQQASPVRVVPQPTDVKPLEQAPSDPFKQQVIKSLLERVNFPGVHTYGYHTLLTLPKLKASKEVVQIGNDTYLVEKQLGKGTFGIVFKAQCINTRQAVALKYQRPPNFWEFYVCRELQSRLRNSPLVDRFMNVTQGYFSDQASILVSDYIRCGSLLDLVNTVKQKSGKPLKESLCIYFCLEMLRIVEAMHQVKIIHADIKPDNFLIQLHGDNIVLQLIDFGCSIDMSLFPPGSAFMRKINTEDFICCEMRDGRPWNYHTDMFCIAATAHVLLFDKYIQLQKKDGVWSITHRMPRYVRMDLWNMFFSSLLNQQNGPAEHRPLQIMLQDALNNYDDFLGEMRFIINILKNR